MEIIDWDKIRNDFPILSTSRNGKGLVYLDNSATSQKPQVVIDSISSLYNEYNANIHRGIYQISEKTTEEYVDSKKLVAAFINASDYRSIVYTKNATESLNTAALMLENTLQEGDEIIVSISEHHSNLIPWMKLSQRKNLLIKYLHVNEDGEFDMDEFFSLLSERTKVLAVTHVSNVLGTINPVSKMSKEIKDRGGYVVVDGAQAAGHIKIDVEELGADFYSFSGHKMLAPLGIGVLYINENLIESLDPIFYGGEMVDEVSLESIVYKELPFKFEAGTQNYEGAIGLKNAISYINDLGIENIEKRNDYLRNYLEEKLKEISGVKIYGNSKNKSSVVSFTMDRIHPHDIATLLDKDNICVRAGTHCAQPLATYLKCTAFTRASLHFYNNEEDINSFISSLVSISKLFNNG